MPSPTGDTPSHRQAFDLHIEPKLIADLMEVGNFGNGVWKDNLDVIAKRRGLLPVYTGNNPIDRLTCRVEQRELLYDYCWIQHHTNDGILADLKLIAELEYNIVQRWRLIKDFNKLLMGKAPTKLMLFKLGSEKHGKTGIQFGELVSTFKRSLENYPHSNPGECYIFIDTRHHHNKSVLVLEENDSYAPLVGSTIRASYMNRSLFLPIESLKLTDTTELILIRNGVRLVGDLVVMTEAEILLLRYFGQNSLSAVRKALERLGLALGTCMPSWPNPQRQGCKREAGLSPDG